MANPRGRVWDKMSARLTCWGLALVAVLAWSAPRAEAQGWREDRRGTEGIGVRVGDLELHPGIRAEAGYDSNVYLADTGSRGSSVLRVTPEFSVSTLGAQRSEGGGAPPTLDFDLGASVPVYHFIDVPQRTLVEANADLGLRLLPERPVSLEFEGRYSRSARPFTEGPLNVRYGRNTLDAAPRLRFQTSGGVLKASVGGRYAYTFFEEGIFNPYDTMTYAATVDAAWEFLPKTALVYEGEVARRDFQGTAPASAGATGLRRDGTRWQFRVGMNGALSARLSATAMVGYVAALFDGGSDKDSPTLALQLRWRPSDTVTTSVGYDRTLSAAYQGNYQISDRVNAKVDLLMAGAFLLTLEGNYTHLQFGADGILDGTQRARADHRLGARLSGEYRFTEWFAITADVSGTKVITDYEFQSAIAMMPTVVDPVRYDRFNAFVGLRIFY